MRILRCIPTVNPAWGGPLAGMLASAREHQRLGHSTEIVTLDHPGDAWVEACEFAVHPVGSVWSGRFSSGYISWLKANAPAFDGIVFHGLWRYISIGGWLALRNVAPYAVFVHGSLDPWFGREQPLKGAIKQAYFALFERQVLRGASAVLYTAEEELRLAKLAYRLLPLSNAKVVAYGVDAPPAATEQQRDVFYSHVPTLRDRPFILFLSRIHEKKGCDLLVRAFAGMADRYGNIDLVIAGPDESGLVPDLQRLAEQLGVEGRIHWPGMLTGDAKWGAFRSAMAFALPSHTENFGLAIAEALGCGLPVLATNKVNTWREIAAYEAGFIGPDTLDGIEACLSALLQATPEKLKTMSANGIRLHSERFNSAIAARDLISILKSARASSEVS